MTDIHSLIAVNAAELRKLKCMNYNAREYMKALKDDKKTSKMRMIIGAGN